MVLGGGLWEPLGHKDGLLKNRINSFLKKRLQRALWLPHGIQDGKLQARRGFHKNPTILAPWLLGF
jgi:hypothetical protein